MVKSVEPHSASRRIVHRTRGRSHGPINRLMSPSDLGQVVKPFVFLDFIDMDGPGFDGPLHPHSGIATLTYLADGAVNYIDHDGTRGKMSSGSVEWMQAGRGMWHGGGVESGRMHGFQLWIALPPELEHSPPESRYVGAEEVPQRGPARVLFGEHEGVRSVIQANLDLTYLAVRLPAGQSWEYVPPAGHDVLWIAVASGSLASPDRAMAGEMIVFEPGKQGVTFTAADEVEFVLGSARPHDHDLVLGHYSVHTSAQALQRGEQEIASLDRQLRRDGRI